MKSRDFNEEQLTYLYGNEKFILFVNQYFGTYSTYINNISIDFDIDEEFKIEEMELYLRVILANIIELKKLIDQIEKKISYIYSEEKKNIQGEIRGSLLIDEYIRKKTMQSMPKTYPCIIKKKTYLTPENLYLFYIIDHVVSKLEELLSQLSIKFKDSRKFTEAVLLEINIKYFSFLKMLPIFSEARKKLRKLERIYGNNHFPQDLKEQIQQRINKRKMRNYYSYQKVFQWFEKYFDNGLTFVDHNIFDVLSYDSAFDDKLFELWILYKLKETFIYEYKLELIESNHLKDRFSKPIYKITTTNGNTLELYFQKGHDLFWDNKNNNKWKYVRLNERYPLRAIPDIVLKYYGENEIVVLIDAKNRVKIAGKNADEIYKMLGYYENFGDYLQYKYGKTFKYNAALVFRNDIEPFKELLNTDSDDSMLNLSVSPVEEDSLNRNQYKELCRYLLEVCGKEGNTTEVIGEYKRDIESKKDAIEEVFKSNDEDLIENLIYTISDKNHQIITNIFSAPELQLQIESVKRKLERDHFPHIWNSMKENSKTILAMAESLFMNLKDSENADYAPICLEYCRALECELNNALIKPFKAVSNISNLISKSDSYKKLSMDRDLSLGEVIFLISKCNVNNRFKTCDLKNYIVDNVKNNIDLLGVCVTDLTNINMDFRRKSAHTSIMNYSDLVECRQRILGIGRINIFYILLERVIDGGIK